MKGDKGEYMCCIGYPELPCQDVYTTGPSESLNPSSYLNCNPFSEPRLSNDSPSGALEFAGTLLGFDDYVSMYLLLPLSPVLSGSSPLCSIQECSAHTGRRHGPRGRDGIVRPIRTPIPFASPSPNCCPRELKGKSVDYSDYTGENIKLDKILLNGNNVCMVLLPPPLPSPF